MIASRLREKYVCGEPVTIDNFVMDTIIIIIIIIFYIEHASEHPAVLYNFLIK